jgi:hypothetical protein
MWEFFVSSELIKGHCRHFCKPLTRGNTRVALSSIRKGVDKTYSGALTAHIDIVKACSPETLFFIIVFSIERPSAGSPIHEKLASDANRDRIQDFYRDQQTRMTSHLDNATFFDVYLAYPDSPPRSSAHQPPQSHCSLSQIPRTPHVNHTHPLLEHIWNQLVQDGKYREGAWVDLPKDNKSNILEKDMYNVLTPIFERIASLTEEYYPEIKRIPGKWLDTSKTPLQSWSKSAVPDLKPGFVFAHDETSADEVRLTPPLYPYIQL